jgi:hypothetical protein
MSEQQQVKWERRRAVLWDVYHDSGVQSEGVERTVTKSDPHSDGASVPGNV